MGDKRVTIENKRLLALFDGADENKMDFVRENVRQLSWYNVRIRDLQKAIDEAGTKEHYQHGREQSGNHANPDIRTLIDLQKLTNAIVKVLLPLVPEKIIPFDDFAEFRPGGAEYRPGGLALNLDDV